MTKRELTVKTTTHIRSTFLDYFVRQGHTHVASSPLVPHNDPTLLFTNAGMVQFKDVFTGLENRAYTRATTSQKCLRAGGKHNDLENVGFTARHHTFFEMLGNFSFGDYFKEDAIRFAWECVTKEYGLPKDRLWITVFSEDDEAASYWKKIAGLSDDRIIRIPTSDNFWSMGDTGPCGPCSEIFYDHGDHIPGGLPGTPEAEGDRFVEIWNLVFMQFEQLSNGERISLPKPSIDTGMGLERIACVLQGIHNNYETDLFQGIIHCCEDILQKKSTQENIASYRVIADHLRAASFLIADGVLPANEGRGYVLRRIMRRAMRHAHLLGSKDALLHQLFPALKDQMGSTYPELTRAQALITQTLHKEEDRFRDMLDRGLKLLQEETIHLPKGAPLAGEIAFKLYDTFGFPLDLTQDALKAQGRLVDHEGFQTAMEKQRAESRAHWAGSGEEKTDEIWFNLAQTHGATEFLGYELEQADAQIIAIVHKGDVVERAHEGQELMILTNQTPFYGESGGQMGDQGTLQGSQGNVEIKDTLKKLGKLHVHIGVLEKGSLAVGEAVKLSVKKDRRQGLRCHHSATHLLHKALRLVLGDHVTQKGSLVDEDRLRFDFSHHQGVTSEELKEIEKIVNQQILLNLPATTQILSPEEAIAQGAMALFGEKYGEEVRVISMGEKEEPPFSIELCGGTHVSRTGDIGFLKILSESSVSSGIRRIEAICGLKVQSYVNQLQEIIDCACKVLKTSPQDLSEKLQSLWEDKRKLENETKNLKQQLLAGGEQKSLTPYQSLDVSGLSVQFHKISGEMGQLRPLIDRLKNDIKSGVIIIAGLGESKVSLLVGVTADLTSKVNAVSLIQEGSRILGGTGGGRPDFAQGGGPNLEAIEEAFKAIENLLRQQI